MVDLLHVERLLLVELRFALFLRPCHLFLLLQGLVESIGHLLLFTIHIFTHLIKFFFGLQLDPLALPQRLSKALPTCLFAS